jgi:TetR/AcrR family transcriptional regulator, regulator of autoinduction and epiphytic fitness
VTTEPRTDGRTARAERTRAAIVDAHLALISEGDLSPSGERIAERAGISLRTLWTNYKDMETLFKASGERVLADQLAAYEPVDATLPLHKRIDAYCRQRARLLQAIAPAARAAAMREPVSPQLQRNRRKHIARVTAEVEHLFAAELGGDTALLHAVVAASMFPAWSMLVDGLALDPESARTVMTRTITSLFASALAASATYRPEG